MSRALFLASSLGLLQCVRPLPPPIGALPGAGLRRLYCVDPPSCTIYRSEQPTAMQFDFLARRYGIKSVLKLNDALPFDGGDDVVPPDVKLIPHPWLPAGPVTRAEVESTLEDLDNAPKPVLAHCSRGVDRTGLLIALWRVTRQHALPAAAWAEWIAYGRDPRLTLFSEAFEHATGWQPQ